VERDVTPQTREEQGLAMQKRIVGADRVDAMYAGAPADEGHLQRYLSASCFGDHYTRTGAAAAVHRVPAHAARRPAHRRRHSGRIARSTDMDHRPLGRTGVSVSKLCLGTMMFGDWGTKDHEESVRIIHRALDAGINFVDTADVYSQGESEVIVGQALKGRRDDVVLATKFFMPFDDDPNHRGGSRRWIMTAVESSLRRLGTDHIDLYQMHRYDPTVDLDETLGALTDLVRAGKVRYIGHSTFPASALVDAQYIARDRGRERFVTEQPTYSMLTRNIEHEILPLAQRYGMGVLSYSPLAGGWLSGRYRLDNDQTGPMAASRPANRFDMSLPDNQRKFDAADALAKLADEAGISLIEMAIAFVLRHPAVTSAIIGPRTMEHLEPQLAGADVALTADVLDRIDEIVAPGVTLNPADNGWVNPSLRPAARRR
jgi:aryl-alcohol dehydrogenase-like predicted oxidoreductase